VLPTVVTVGGAGVGAWIGHLALEARRDAGDRAADKELEALLDDGTAALIMVGSGENSDRIEQSYTQHAPRDQAHSRLFLRGRGPRCHRGAGGQQKRMIAP
jgi:hypothetical protein